MALTYNTFNNTFSGYFGPKPTKAVYKYTVENDRVVEIHDVTVHEFTLHDADDPDLYAAVPMIEWQQTEKGTWVMEHAIESPSWYRYIDPVSYGYKYQIRARLRGPDYTYYALKWCSK
jgi:hypothetical protein